MFGDLKNKTILVTGAGGGIGKALCDELMKTAGASVIAVVRSTVHADELQKEYPFMKIIVVDLTDLESVRKAFHQLPNNSIDGLVNNAGIAIIKAFADFTEKDFDDTFDINIKAVIFLTQSLLTKLRDGASIVMVSSLAASRSFHGHAIYSASKAALDSLTKSLALELADRQIRVNTVNPTVVMTKMGRENWSEPNKAAKLLDRIPLKRFCEVHEVIKAIAYLLSSKSSFVNGHHLNLEGGYCIT